MKVGLSVDWRKGTIRYWAFAPVALCACDFDDPEPNGEVRGRTAPTSVSASSRAPNGRALASASSLPAFKSSALVAMALDAGSVPPAPSMVAAAKKDDSRACPKHMLEVNGKYCPEVMHRCVKGGKSHTGEDAEEPEPFYCDAYLVGSVRCFGKEEPKHFCIDEFEYPNQVGTIPAVMVTWYEARRLCEVQGRRLCGDDEWTLACEGPERLPYPYGWVRDRTACNIDHLWIAPNDGLLANRLAPATEIQTEIDRLSKRVPSGSMPRCKSGYGVMDMTGNVDEWAVNVTLDGKPYHSIFKGGHWVSGARNRCRPVTASHDENTAYYAEGFRCCANVAKTP